MITIKTRGVDKLTNDLAAATQALKGLDGELGTVRFDPTSPESIESAIEEVERLVDERVGSSLSNPIIGPMARAMKEKYREAILQKAAEARLASE